MNWHLSMMVNIDLGPPAFVRFKPYICFSEDGKTLISEPKRTTALRRRICKTWWSRQWRLDVATETALTPATTIKTSLELAHRSGQAPVASGEALGLFGFDIDGGVQRDTWIRAGLDIDQKLGEVAVLSLSVHAATQGKDTTISSALGLRSAF